ncbi:unnamed protein product, partial [Trypanosoma congolense IL3000]
MVGNETYERSHVSRKSGSCEIMEEPPHIGLKDGVVLDKTPTTVTSMGQLRTGSHDFNSDANFTASGSRDANCISGTIWCRGAPQAGPVGMGPGSTCTYKRGDSSQTTETWSQRSWLHQEIGSHSRGSESVELTPTLPVAADTIGDEAQQMGISTPYAPYGEVTPAAAESHAPKPGVAPTHSSLFYPHGFQCRPPVLLHYVSLAGWRTVPGGWDFFTHRRLKRGDVIGHAVRWLHNARPRDRFVFTISPVEPKAEGSVENMWEKLRKRFFGDPPAFASYRGKQVSHSHSEAECAGLDNCEPMSLPICLRTLLQRNTGNSASGDRAVHEQQRSVAGVEVVEVMHADVTAIDYSPRLLTSRLAIEVKAVYVYFFNSMEDVFDYYECPEALALIDQQERMGVSNTVPWDYPSDAKKSSGSVGSSARNSGVNTHPLTAPALSTRFRKPSNEKKVTSSSQHVDVNQRRVEPSHHRDDHISRKEPRLSGEECGHFVRQEWRSSSCCSTTAQEALPTSPNISAAPHTEAKCEGSQEVGGRGTLPGRYVHSRKVPMSTNMYFDTIVTLHSEDPDFNAVLREVLIPEPGTHPYTASPGEQRRLLSMYEGGMPAWTVFLAATGLPYRRALRLTFVGLVNLWPIVSLFVGLYDLYKHLPQMKVFLSSTLEPFLDWVEEHVAVRVSMMVTYIVSVCLTVASAFISFLSQFYLLELVLYPLSIFSFLLNPPARLLFNVLLTSLSIITSFLSLLWVTLKVLFVGPFLFVSHIAALDIGLFASAGGGSVIPAAVEGTSLTMKWWRAWQEFWV